MTSASLSLRPTHEGAAVELHEGDLLEVSLSPAIARIRGAHTDTYWVSPDAAVALRRLVGRRILYRLRGWEIAAFEPLGSQVEADEEAGEAGVG